MKNFIFLYLIFFLIFVTIKSNNENEENTDAMTPAELDELLNILDDYKDLKISKNIKIYVSKKRGMFPNIDDLNDEFKKEKEEIIMKINFRLRDDRNLF